VVPKPLPAAVFAVRRWYLLALPRPTPSGSLKVIDRFAQAVARGGSRCASHVLNRDALADARGAEQVLYRGAMADALGAAQVQESHARFLLNPPCSLAAFVVNSEPHNEARP
jgi:hypothetical protein